MKPPSEPTLDWRLRVFDSLVYPALVLDPDRIIVAANQKFLDSINASLEEVVGESCVALFTGRTSDPNLPCSQEECPLRSTLETGEGHSLLRWVEEPGGRGRCEDRVFSPILDEAGKVAFVIESIRDVTRLKNLERRFSEIREFLDRVIQSSASAIIAADRHGKILLMNEAAKQLFGCTFHVMRQHDIRDLYPPGMAEEVMRRLRDSEGGGRGKLPPTRMEVLHSSGERIPVEMTAAIIYEGDRESATMGIYNDLREKLAVEHELEMARYQLVQSDKMASLGRLAAGVAHEINNPLTGIMLYGNMMLENLGEDQEMRRQVDCVLEDATRCQEIVRGLLAYSRQSGSRRERFALNDLVVESLALIRDQKLFLNVEVRRDLAPEPCTVQGDRKQLSQVVINLVMNALDAMQGKGVLTLRTYPCLAERRVCLEVVDTGCGIPLEHLGLIFEPFFTTKELGKGTGLGLSTAYGIVEENGGLIRVSESGPDGTCFLIELPMVSLLAESNGETIG